MHFLRAHSRRDIVTNRVPPPEERAPEICVFFLSNSKLCIDGHAATGAPEIAFDGDSVDLTGTRMPPVPSQFRIEKSQT